MNAVLYFDGTGIIRCFHTDGLPLQELGRLAISRASTVEFNESTQSWEVRDLTGKVLFQHPSRRASLDWENDHFNR